MKKIIKDSLILFLITAIAGLLLAFVNEITKGPIESQKLDAIQNACRTVFSDASSFEEITPKEIENSKIVVTEIYEAKNSSGSRLGYVINLSTKEGYGSEISFAMGVTNERHLNGISILSSQETVGLGLEAETVLVPQFMDKDVTTFTYTKTGSQSDSEIDAISSATITTRAFVNAVNEGLIYFDNNLAKEGE